MINHESEIKKLFELQDVLYETGARNFMLIDAPPIFQCPCGKPILIHISKPNVQSLNIMHL